MPELFGKRYDWDLVSGQLVLRPEWTAPAEATSGPMVYDDFVEALRMLEAEPYPIPRLYDRTGRVLSDGIGEREGRIPMAGGGHGVSDEEAG